MTIPNMLTMMRIFLLPILVVVFYVPFKGSSVLCAAIFALACLTDWFDGYLARRLKQTSAFGAFFDPVADKLIVVTALVLIVGKHGSAWVTIPAVIIIGREIIVSALREWMAELGKRASVAVSMLGKVKTVMQMLAILLLLLFNKHEPFDSYLVSLGYILFYVAAVLTIWSMLLYLRVAWPSLSMRGNQTEN